MSRYEVEWAGSATPEEKAFNLTPMDVIQRRAREARDDNYYDKLYALKLFLAGDAQAVRDFLGGAMPSYSSDQDLGDYPNVDPPLGNQGLQNHGLISSRINVQAIVYADPEFHFATDDVNLKEVNAAYIRDLWETQDWGAMFNECGMDVEACGIGFAELGVGEEHDTVLRRRDPLDVLWDPAYRSPGQWRYFFSRTRLSMEEALDKYGPSGITMERLQEIATPAPLNVTRGAAASRINAGQIDIKFVHEWCYWDKNTHCVFLGSICNAKKSEYLGYNAQLEYELGVTGINPFGCIPLAVWFDSWAPGVKRPVGKAETTWRTATMLNALEAYMRETLRRGIPMNFISSFGFTPKQIKEIQEAQGIEDLEKLFVVDMPDVRAAIFRQPAAEIPMSVTNLRNIYKEELNASTGVSDSQRGQPLPGDKTAFEVRTLNQAQGVQARHTRRQFAKFLTQVVQIARTIGSLYDTKRRLLGLSDGVMDTAVIPLKPFLSHPMQVLIHENSLQYMTEDDQIRRRLEQFQTVDLTLMQAGAVDPMKVALDVYKKLGIKDPYTLVYTPQEIQQQQEQAAAHRQQEMAMAQQQQAQELASKNGGQTGIPSNSVAPTDNPSDNNNGQGADIQQLLDQMGSFAGG